MASQLNCTSLEVGISATKDMFKSLGSLQEGESRCVIVRVSRKPEELDFMSTTDVTSVDVFESELHAVIPKNLIWKYDKLVREGFCVLYQHIALGRSQTKIQPSPQQ
ncbi:hypothetical protein MKX01_036549 [Papaver californicum]|nr:hypothetical protein MKX01_036549 [Papaver californicum]